MGQRDPRKTPEPGDVTRSGPSRIAVWAVDSERVHYYQIDLDGSVTPDSCTLCVWTEYAPRDVVEVVGGARFNPDTFDALVSE